MKRVPSKSSMYRRGHNHTQSKDSSRFNLPLSQNNAQKGRNDEVLASDTVTTRVGSTLSKESA